MTDPVVPKAGQAKPAPQGDLAIKSLLTGLAGMMGSGDGGNKYSGFAYLGKYVGADPKKDHSEKGSAGTRAGSNIDLVKTLPLRWRDTGRASNKKQMERLIAAVTDATGRPPASFDEALELWEKATDKSSAMWQATLGGAKGQPTTPWQELAKAATDRKMGVANTLAGDAGKTTTHKRIQDVSDGDAWSQINATVTNLMGRAATDSEVREFAHRANQIAANNPTLETTTTDASGNTVTKSSGGATAGDFELAARKQAFADPEAGAYQAAGPLYNAFVEALSSQVDI